MCRKLAGEQVGEQLEFSAKAVTPGVKNFVWR